MKTKLATAAAIAAALSSTAPAAAQGYFSDLRPWSADCVSRSSLYDRSAPTKIMHLHVNTVANTVTRVDEQGQSSTFKLNMALPSRYSPFPDMEVANDTDGVYMLSTSEQLGGYAWWSRANPFKPYICSPYYDR